MANEDDLEARKARAADIREQISRIIGPGKSQGGDATKSDADSLPPLSPREFIEKRMRELDSAKDAGKTKPGEPQDDK